MREKIYVVSDHYVVFVTMELIFRITNLFSVHLKLYVFFIIFLSLLINFKSFLTTKMSKEANQKRNVATTLKKTAQDLFANKKYKEAAAFDQFNANALFIYLEMITMHDYSALLV